MRRLRERLTDGTRATLFTTTAQKAVELKAAARTSSQAFTSIIIQAQRDLLTRFRKQPRLRAPITGLCIRSFSVNVRGLCFCLG